MLRYMNDANGRWYTISLHRDLFGELVIERTWGSVNNHLGGSASDPVACCTELRRTLRELLAHRRSKGYRRFRG